MEKTINELCTEVHEGVKKRGFWEEPMPVGQGLMLMVSELAEALEADRKGRYANMDAFNIDRQGTPFHENALTKSAFEEHIKDTFEDELADTVIRIFDWCGAMSIDLEKHIELKMAYNETREYKHGKAY